MRINLEDNKGQIITSVEIQEDDTLENIDGFYEIKGGKMKRRAGHRICPKCHRSSLQMSPGEFRTCPICGHRWQAKEGK